MASQATVTAPTGPAVTNTAVVLTGLREFSLELAGKNVLRTVSDKGNVQFDINATTTLTCTITAGGNATIVVSQ